jgi:hypothetical protein
MKKLLITNPKFTGEVEVYYNDGILQRIDFGATDMMAGDIAVFKNIVPAVYHELQGAFGSKTTIVEDAFEITFDMLYKDYPLKRNRYKGEKIFEKMDKTDTVEAWFNLIEYKKYLRRNSHYLTPMIIDRYLGSKEYKTDWSKLK